MVLITYKVAIPRIWMEHHHALVLSILTSYEIIPYSSNHKRASLEDLEECDAIVSSFPFLGEEVMDHMKQLKLISLPGTGYWDYIDIRAANERNIAVTNIKDYATSTIAEYTFGLILAITRNIILAHLSVLRNNWESSSLMGVSLKGKKLGLIGLGKIGTEVARLANAFGMEVLCYTKRPSPSRAQLAGVSFCELEELLSQSNVISMHVSLNEETKGMIGKQELDIIKPGTYLINTARGGLVDTDALYDALQTKKLAGAALDVTDPEPLPEKHKLLSLENIIITPHIAALTKTAIQHSIQYALENITAFFEGNGKNIVNEDSISK